MWKYINMTTNKYEKIFDNAPIGIWEEDWREIESIFNTLREIVPPEDFEEYLNENPSFVNRLINSIRIIRVNKKASDMHEASSIEELLRTPITQTFCESSLDCFKNQMVSLYRGEKLFEMETKIRTLKGNFIYVIIQVEFPTRSAYDNVIIVMTDITQSKINYQKYLETKAKFHRSFYQGVVGMIITNIDGEIIETNNAFCELTKYTTNELNKTTIDDIIDDPHLIRIDMDILLTNNIEDCSLKGERHIIDKNGNKLWAYVGISLIKNEEGTPIYFVWQAIDIDYEKRINLILENNVHKYQQLLDSTNTIYLILNENSDILEYSESFIELLSLKNDSTAIYKTPLRALISTESIPSYDDAWKKIMSGLTVNNVEISLTKSSKFKWLSMNASMLQNGGKKIFILLTDITKRKREEFERLIAKEKLRDKLKINIRDLRKTIKNYGNT
jgi:PAS domain S-box-containing protein